MATTVFDKPVGTEIGQLSSLTTSNKTNLVNAINSLNSKLSTGYMQTKYCSNNAGTMTMEIPAGKYMFTLIIKSQQAASATFVSAYVDDAASSGFGYVGAYLPTTNPSSMVVTLASTTFIKTYSSASTITVTYTADLYEVGIAAISCN